MEFYDIPITTDFIKVQQLLKLASIISNGSDCKYFLHDNTVMHNGLKVSERGKKIYKSEQIIINDNITISVS